MIVTYCGQGGYFQLNAMMPVTTHYNCSLLLNRYAVNAFAVKRISGIQVNSGKCRQNIENSLYMATALSRIIGYDRAAAVARNAVETGLSIRGVMELEHGALEIPWEQF